MALRDIMLTAGKDVGAHARPVQRRSHEKLSRVMDAARELLVAGGPSAVSTTAVAAAADVSVGWLYNYFENRDAILEEILVGCLTGLDNAMADAGLELSGKHWRAKADAGTKACLDYFANDASFRAIWFSGEFSGRMLQANRLHDDAMAEWLAGTVTHPKLDAPAVPLRTVMDVYVGMLDKGVDLAFRDHPTRANPSVVNEVRRASVEYLATFLA